VLFRSPQNPKTPLFKCVDRHFRNDTINQAKNPKQPEP